MSVLHLLPPAVVKVTRGFLNDYRWLLIIFHAVYCHFDVVVMSFCLFVLKVIIWLAKVWIE